MSVPLFWVDAFADRPFAGNPAAVGDRVGFAGTAVLVAEGKLLA